MKTLFKINQQVVILSRDRETYCIGVVTGIYFEEFTGIYFKKYDFDDGKTPVYIVEYTDMRSSKNRDEFRYTKHNSDIQSIDDFNASLDCDNHFLIVPENIFKFYTDKELKKYGLTKKEIKSFPEDCEICVACKYIKIS